VEEWEKYGGLVKTGRIRSKIKKHGSPDPLLLPEGWNTHRALA